MKNKWIWVGSIVRPTRIRPFFDDKMTYMGFGLETPMVKFFSMTKRQTRREGP